MVWPRLYFLVVVCLPAWSQKLPSCSQNQQEDAATQVQLLQLSSMSRRQNVLLRNAATDLDGLSGWETWSSDQGLKVVYGVFTSPLPKYANQMAAVEETWAKDVPPQKLLVVGVNGSTPGIVYKQAPLCKDGHVTNPGISCKEATLLSTGYALGADWVVVIGSDNYVFPRNFEQRLLQQNANEAQVLGIFGCGEGKYCEDHKGGICGGAGYAISRGALDKMIGKGENAGEMFVQESMETARTIGGYWSDQVTSCLARRRGVQEVQMSNLYGWRLCENPGKMQCAFNETTYRRKIESPHHKPLTFHYISPQDMHKIYSMAHGTGVSLFGLEAVAHVKEWKHGKDQTVSLSLLSSSVGGDTYERQREEYIILMDKEVYSSNASWASEIKFGY